MNEEVIQTILESLRYSKHKIQEFDYSYGHYEPEQAASYAKMRHDALVPLEAAERAIRKIWGRQK